ncbi:MAG: hypothetical protein QOF01_3789 [Thermomicrobiales bacterium]|nr:hypothetical protein [Thermomicrobiales bacterium]
MVQHRLARLGALGPLFVVFGLIGTLIAPATSAEEWSPPSTVWVEEAGHTVDGLFLTDWRAYGELYGQPITEEIKSKVALGGEKPSTYTVQYFENLAIAYVPEEEREGWDVQALPLGAEALKQDQGILEKLKLAGNGTCTGLTADTCTRFAENGHTVRMGFKEFWDANDGERLLGKPLTEEFVGANKVTTQYFENGVLTWTKITGVTVRPIGTETAKRLKLKTAKIAQPVDVPVYDEALFQEPEGVGGFDLGTGPGPQQGGYKEIVISISASSIWAYEDGDLVASSLVSTGTGEVPETVTPIGYFSVLVKYDTQTMEGTISDEFYRVEDVPYVMYFDDLGNAIHGAYWHNNFGTPMSHGCVNLPLDVAAYLYDWAPEGTPVSIIE